MIGKNLTRYEPPSSDWLEKISTNLRISPAIAQIIWNRGLKSFESVKNFLHPEDQNFTDPFRLKDMHSAVNRIESAISNREKICVYGDYDVDGMSSVAILVRALQNLGAEVSYYIPERESEGYGLNLFAIRSLISSGVKLIVTVDNGISAVNEIAEMNDRVDFVVTDHHEPGEEIPAAVAVIDPKRRDCPYPNKNLCGCAVAFKLIQALYQQLRGEKFESELDIVALATVADLVPLIGENRKFVRVGLQVINTNPCVGIRALIESSGLLDRKISEYNIGFMLAPRLNSAGRISSAKLGVELLSTNEFARAREIAETLEDLNNQRRDLEKIVAAEAEEKFLAEQKKPPAIIVDGDDWNGGVIGLAASKLVEKYYLPTLVFTHIGSMYVGSCRSIDGLNMFDALTEFKDLFERYGGHPKAAGVSIPERNFAAFKKNFLEYVSTHLTAKDYIETLVVDSMLDPRAVDLKLVEEVENLSPFGVGNPSPVFGWKNVRASNVKKIGRDQNHLTFSVGNIRCVGWRMADEFLTVANEPFTFIYSVERNEFNGIESPQCTAIYIEPSRKIL